MLCIYCLPLVSPLIQNLWERYLYGYIIIGLIGLMIIVNLGMIVRTLIQSLNKKWLNQKKRIVMKIGGSYVNFRLRKRCCFHVKEQVSVEVAKMSK